MKPRTKVKPFLVLRSRTAAKTGAHTWQWSSASPLSPALGRACLAIVAVLSVCLLRDSAFCEAKVFERCELAQVLHHKHRLDLHEVAKWVCIAQHSSGLNSTAYAASLEGGSHGLFQISDVYWCSPPGKGFACNVPCARLRDDDLTDDLTCLHIIRAEHQRLSGDGYNAWNAYQQFCQHKAQSYIEGCFPSARAVSGAVHTAASTTHYTPNALTVYSNSISDYSPKKRGKVYGRCELAQELYYKHKMPMEEIPTWVCIAQHESHFDTSAVGRLNADGSVDHGLFQISDLYWCSHDRYAGKACGIQCNKLLDDDLTDDLRCVRRIHNEHSRISGDGFNAWTVYNRNCSNQQYELVAPCFKEKSPQFSKAYSTELAVPQTSVAPQPHKSNAFFKRVDLPTKSSQFHYMKTTHAYAHTHTRTQAHSQSHAHTHKGKVYNRCELAQELYFKHKFPMQDIATWVCIAQHESNFDTSAVSRLNSDGSADHGLFQISDRYWCSHDSGGGKACRLPCDKLLDSDISDDVRCVRIIHEEHTRISGDGFTAWTVYNRNCRDQQLEQVATCFDSNELSKAQKIANSYTTTTTTTQDAQKQGAPAVEKGRVYQECELAQELYFKHKMPLEQIPTWTCIAKHESSYNTAAVGRLNTDGSADHGLFQISDLYWCSHDSGGGKACNIACSKLLDNDLTDDVRCVKTIYEEHTRLSGDGFTAWTVYNRNCRNQPLERIAPCLPIKELQEVSKPPAASSAPDSGIGKGKVYSKCELAQELYFKHKMPMKLVPTWVCIARYESSFNTAAVGRLNTDGSADHGLFQISDLYWCSHDSGGGKACNIACSKLLDNDLTDDVRCVKTIYEEHTRLSGDGFTAWTVYNRNCRNQQLDKVASCFDNKELEKAVTQANNVIPVNTNTNALADSEPGKRKLYSKCELAQELYYKHKFLISEIPTWVCIAEHESSFDTSAIGRLNSDGSAYHGLFQISDRYWCAHDNEGGKACNMPCNKLIDADITDDVRCVHIIYEEHTRISGDGFTAWTVYDRNCRNQQIEHISSCFDSQELQKAQRTVGSHVHTKKPIVAHTHPVSHIVAHAPKKYIPKGPINHPFVHNPFLNQFNATGEFAPSTASPTTVIKQPPAYHAPSNDIPAFGAEKLSFAGNPFLQKYIGGGQSVAAQRQRSTTTTPTPRRANHAPFAANPFLSKYKFSPPKDQSSAQFPQHLNRIDSKQKYYANPFLSKYASGTQPTKGGSAISVAVNTPPKTVPLAAHKAPNVFAYQHNPFLQAISKPSKSDFSSQQQQQSANTASTEITKLQAHPTRPYLSSDSFRTTPIKENEPKLATTTKTPVLSAPTKITPTRRPITNDIPKRPTTTTTTPRRPTTTTLRPTTQQTTKHFTTNYFTTTTKRPTTTATILRKLPAHVYSYANLSASAATTTRRPGTTTTWNWKDHQVQPTKASKTTHQPSATKTYTQIPKTTIPATSTKPPRTTVTTTIITTRRPSTQETAAVLGNTLKLLPTAKPQVMTTKLPSTGQHALTRPATTTRKAEAFNKKVQTTATHKLTDTVNKKETQELLAKTTKSTSFSWSSTKSGAATTTRPATTNWAGYNIKTQTTTTKKPVHILASSSSRNVVSAISNSRKTTEIQPKVEATTKKVTTTRSPTTIWTGQTLTTTKKATTTTTRRATSTRSSYAITTTKMPTTTTTGKTTTTTTRRPTTTTTRMATTTTTRRPTTNTTRRATTISTGQTRITSRKPTNTTSSRPITTTTRGATTISTGQTRITTRKLTNTTSRRPTTTTPRRSTNITTRRPTTTTTKIPTTTVKNSRIHSSPSYIASRVTTITTKNHPQSTTTTTKLPYHKTTNGSGNKYRDDPFSHPFFAKYNEQLKVFASTTTRKPLTTYISQIGATSINGTSEYYQQFRNNTNKNAKTVYAYSFGQGSG